MENKRKCEEKDEEERKRVCRENSLSVEYLTGPDDGIVVLSLARPEARNALDSGLVLGLQTALAKISQAGSARCLILESSVPGVFSAGADLKERQGMSEEAVLSFLADLKHLVSSLESLPLPVLAQVDGPALGGGLELLLGCDLIVSSERAVFGLPETGLGVMPGAGGTVRLAGILGPGRAASLVLAGQRISGQQAEQWGLVARQVQHQDLQLTTRELARQIVRAAPRALAMAKYSLQSARYLGKAAGLELETACYANLLSSRDRREGLLAWSQRRPPAFTGE